MNLHNQGKKKILFIGGSLNQTSMVHAVARYLAADYDCFFTPYYCDDFVVNKIVQAGWLDFTSLGGVFRAQTEEYLAHHNLPVDYAGRSGHYHLVVTTSDILVQHNIRDKKIVLIQEGMTDPENVMFYLVKNFRLPRWMTVNTSTTGMSGAYRYFCVASEGYRDLFIGKGASPEKILVTGIPNFDHAAGFLDNDFPLRDYILVATSDVRETKRFDNREAFIREALSIADGRPVVFKLHPNEQHERATREIRSLAPHAKIFTGGNTGHIVANCAELVTQYSSVVYIGMALSKPVHSYFDLEMLRKLLPVQNGGRSGENIAAVCRRVLEEDQLKMTG